MSVLERFLSILERSGVDELCLCEGSPAAARAGGKLHPITQRALRNSDILAILANTPLEAVVRNATDGSPSVVKLGSRLLRVLVRREDNSLEIYISVARANEPTAAEILIQPSRQWSREVQPVEAHANDDLTNASDFDSEATLTDILLQARRDGVSDVHLVSGEPIRRRLVGRLTPCGRPWPHTQLAAELEGLLIESRRSALDVRGYVDFSADDAHTGRLRVNVCRQRTGLKACIRLIPERPPTLLELGLPPELRKAQDYHQGLIVISGPNGHGKTSTLAALVDMFNQTRPAHIITVEDPVEFIHSPKRCVVSQREVGVHTRTFQTALKGALREDPDIITIGELRDRETVEMALTAAETGHVVLSTMSTPNGASTIERLIDMFAPEDQAQVRATLAGALKLVISQRLVPNIDASRLLAAAELITGNVPLWTLIRENKLYQLPSLLQRGRAYGMIRVEDSLNDLIDKGAIDIDVARAFADEPKNISCGAKQTAVAPAMPNPANATGLAGMFRKRS